jgi:hypothetical protein
MNYSDASSAIGRDGRSCPTTKEGPRRGPPTLAEGPGPAKRLAIGLDIVSASIILIYGWIMAVLVSPSLVGFLEGSSRESALSLLLHLLTLSPVVITGALLLGVIGPVVCLCATPGAPGKGALLLCIIWAALALLITLCGRVVILPGYVDLVVGLSISLYFGTFLIFVRSLGTSMSRPEAVRACCSSMTGLFAASILFIAYGVPIVISLPDLGLSFRLLYTVAPVALLLATTWSVARGVRAVAPLRHSLKRRQIERNPGSV